MSETIQTQIVMIRAEINTMQRVGCGHCGKLIATKGVDGRILIKCARCKTITVINP